MKSLIIYLGKKYVISGINDLLEKYKDNVTEISGTLELWIKRLQIVIEELKTILSRVSDGKIEDEEVKDSVKEIEKIVKDWK